MLPRATPPGLVWRELLHESPRASVFRAFETATGASLMVKTPSQPIPSASEFAAYRQESLLANLLQPDSTRCLEHGGSIFLLRSDCGGQTLDRLSPQEVDVHALLSQALRQLEVLQREGVVHQEIQPSHLLWSARNGLRLLGWSAATGRATHPGDLRYRAPEQTGRLQLGVDSRTDLYGLGISLWQFLSRRQPFAELEDPLELIHAVLAVELEPLEGEFGGLIRRLLAKDPGQRFATPEDARQRLPLPWIERAAECQALEEALTEVHRGGQCTVLVQGATGMGKTALLGEMGRRWIGRSQLRLGRGRYLGFAPNHPRQGLLAALEEVVGGILASPESQRLQWLAGPGQALESYGDVLVSLLPPLGACLNASPLPLAERPQPDISVAVAALVAVLAHPERPLVLLLDDVHQADEDQRRLLDFLVADSSVQGLLLVATSSLEPEAFGSARRLLRLGLPPLSSQALQQALEGIQPGQSQEADWYDQCQGNPLMLRFLWTGQQRQQARGSVLELLLEQFRQLPEEARECLIWAAGLGQRFQLDDLAEGLQHPAEHLLERLTQPLQRGLLEVLDGSYQFCHQELHQQAYLGMTAARRAEQHLLWGRLLTRRKESPLIEGAEQLRLGLSAMVGQPERCEFAALALRASQQLRLAGAFERALQLMRAARQASEKAWSGHYRLRLEVMHELHRLCLILGEHEELSQGLDEVAVHSRSLVDEIPAWIARIRLLNAQGQVRQAYRVAQDFLERAGRPMNFAGGGLSLGAALMRTLWVLRGRPPEALRDLPETRDPLLCAIQEVQTLSAPLQARVQPETLPLGILRDVRCLLEDGLTAEGAQAWTGFGLLLCRGLGQVELGIRFADLALFQVRRLQRPDIWPRVALLAYLMVHPWGRTLESIRPEMEHIALRAMAWGDTMVGFLASIVARVLDLVLGRPLSEVLQQTRDTRSRMSQHGHRDGMAEMRSLEDCLRGLQQGQLPQLPPLQLDDDPMRSPILFVRLQLAMVFQRQDLALELVRQGGALMDSPAVGALGFVFWTYAGVTLHRAGEVVEGQRAEKRVARWASQVTQRGWRVDWLRAAAARASSAPLVKTLELYERALEGARRQGMCQDAALIAEEAAEYLLRLRPTLARDYRAQAAAFYRQWGAWGKADLLDPPEPARAIAMDLDLQTILRASQALSSEVELPSLLRRLLRLALENAGGQRGALLLRETGGWSLAVEAVVGEEPALLHQPLDLNEPHPLLPTSVLRFTLQTRQLVIVNEAFQLPAFAEDAFLRQHRPRSLLCLPLEHGGELVGLLYLEHSLASEALAAERAEVLRTLSAQMAISLQNARHVRQILAEQELRHQEALKLQALESRKDALAAVLGIASHDLKNPLAVIQMWMNQLGPEPESQRLLQVQRNVEAACQRAQSLIATYLDVAALERGRMLELHTSEVALDGLLETEIEFLLDTLPPPQRALACLEWELQPLRARVDPERIRQVVGNLVGNALKFCPPGSPIRVVLGACAEGWELEVIDRGPGIAAELQSRLFEPFERRTSEVQGSGLGLWICRVIVEAHQGQLGLVSPWEGAGCRFWCRVPG